MKQTYLSTYLPTSLYTYPSIYPPTHPSLSSLPARTCLTHGATRSAPHGCTAPSSIDPHPISPVHIASPALSLRRSGSPGGAEDIARGGKTKCQALLPFPRLRGKGEWGGEGGLGEGGWQLFRGLFPAYLIAGVDRVLWKLSISDFPGFLLSCVV